MDEDLNSFQRAESKKYKFSVKYKFKGKIEFMILISCDFELE